MTAADNKRTGSAKGPLIFVACALLAAGLAFAGYKFYQKSSSRPLTAAETKEAVTKYLTEKSHTHDFKTSLDGVKKDKRIWETLSKQYDSAADYETVYRLIGQHLWIAENLLKSTEKKEQRVGTRVVMEVADMAHDTAVDDWLACRICDAYLVPLFDKDETLSDEDEQLMHFVGRKYAEADEKDKEIDLEKFYLSKVGASRRADAVRYRLVRLLEGAGRHEEAVAVRKQIGASLSASTNLSPKQVVRLQKLTNASLPKRSTSTNSSTPKN